MNEQTPESQQQQQAASSEPSTPMVVGLGASAGGMEALQTFFEAMPANSGMVFVVTLHLQREQKSHLAEILTRRTAMPVTEVTEPIRVRPDHVYIIPPDRVLELRDDTLALSKLPEPRLPRKPVDAFFRSLAKARGHGAVAIVLSGTGGNGSMGVRDVKHHGGIVLVQTPNEAAYPNMPQHALDTGIVDRVLSIHQMPAVLQGYAEHPYIRQRQLEAGSAEPWDKLNAILEVLQSQTGREFRCYKKNTLLRRTLRRMGLRHITSFDAYRDVLREDASEANALAEDLLIGVSSFFRDPEAWRALQREVLSKLFATRQPDQAVRAWVPGCASGEEAYTLAILLHDAAREATWRGDIKVFATDTASQRLQQAREGLFPDSIEADVPDDLLKRYFEHKDESYRVHATVRESVVYAPHDLIVDPPFSQLDLITCRNLLIYLEPETQARVLALFHFALQPGGHLLLGSAEAVSQRANLFDTADKKWRIYRRVGPTRHDLVNRLLADTPGPAAVHDVTAMREAQQRQQQFNEELERRVTERTAMAEQRAEQLRKLTLDLSRAEENERRRIARVLHDDLQQILAGAQFTLDGIRQDSGDEAAAGMGQLKQLLEQALETSRDLSHQLSPPILQEGLLPALQWTRRWCRDKHNLDITVDTDPAAEPQSPDLRYMLYSVARELLLNIAKHADTDQAQVRLERQGQVIRLTVEDQGVGFDPNQLDMNDDVEAFGLMTIHERVTSLGGQVRIIASPGKGSRIVLEVPDPDQDKGEETTSFDSPHPAITSTGAASGTGIRILLVDDHEVMRQGLGALLENDPDMTVIAEAVSGEEAIQMTSAHRPDLVLMDVSMPGMGGVEATRQITRAFPAVVVVGLSMYDSADRANAMAEAGASAYVQKSAPAEALLLAIRVAAGKG
ncbi:MAG: chemotaxis protein CheB [Phycisphaeraceae bacterium]